MSDERRGALPYEDHTIIIQSGMSHMSPSCVPYGLGHRAVVATGHSDQADFRLMASMLSSRSSRQHVVDHRIYAGQGVSDHTRTTGTVVLGRLGRRPPTSSPWLRRPHLLQ